MGRSQRDKGARGERSLVMHLNMLGYKASRVIRTRAVKGIEDEIVPDVIAEKDGNKFTFESKLRKCSFKTIYRLFEAERTDNVYRFLISPEGPLVALGTSLEDVAQVDAFFPLIEKTKTHQRIVNLRKWLKGAQFLFLKDNNCYPLFVRYWR